MKYNVLVVGSGGREHAIGQKLSESNLLGSLHFAPGNAGTAEIGKNISIAVNETEKLKDFALENSIDLVFVGPELPLSLGLVDILETVGIKAFGPSKTAAQLESSKSFSKRFMQKYDLPTADYQVFDDFDTAKAYLTGSSYPIVLKADGLAAGKGVIICENNQQALEALDSMMNQAAFGEEGSRVVIEEFLTGREVSLLCFVDGKTIVPMSTASDYKRAYDNDQGLNTGGMGSISPSPFAVGQNFDDIVSKTLAGINGEGFSYKGVIYIGLILTEAGPKIIEYNARFGDPETEALVPRLQSDLLEIFIAVCEQRLSEIAISWSNQSAVSVIMAAAGYPSTPKKGMIIKIPPSQTDAFVYHCGTLLKGSQVTANGGRVLAVTALGDDLALARERCYNYIKEINFPDSFYRTDIGKVEQ